ncbi:hypothetical protein MYU51_014785 [Penicillium brevicompactum]|uniref:uncharacterized protein n=1 Tax=Penicillium brevicompactum TaxID=5074 RepID=UPI0025405D31|nr:uncharacterized protein N7506_007007 [Penicillium brevicompactum]KAJ5333224.1 hypothetical protein N7506_007007 [Penicillium brevicompactum]
MCGSTFRKPGALAVHLRLRHCGAVNDVDAPRHPEEILRATGVNAIKRFVLTGGWRNAIYSKEPGRAQPESVLGVFCDALENIARKDAAFAAEYGTQFHRDVTNSLNNKLLKYLGVPKSQLEDGSSQQTTTRPSHLQKGLKPAAVAEPEPESESDYESDFESESDPDSEPFAEPTKLISKHEAGDQQHRSSSVAPLAIDIVATNDIEFVSERTIKVEPDVMAGRMIKTEPNAMSELIPKIENGLVIDLTSDEPAVIVDLSTGDEPELEDASWPVEAVTDVFPISVPELEPMLEPMRVSPP